MKDSKPEEHKELLLRAFSAMAPIAMLEVATDGRVTWANDRWFEFVASTSESVLERPWFDVLQHDEQKRVLDIWQNVVAAGSTTTFECRISLPDKRNRFLEFNVAPLLDSTIGTTSYILTAMDVTDKRQLSNLTQTTRELEVWAEQSAATLAQQSKDLGIFAALVASSADAIAIVDPNETVRYVNAAFQKLFDAPAGMAWIELLETLGADEPTARALHSASLSGETCQSIVTLKRPKLGILHAEVSSFSIVDVTSRNIGVALVVRDLSVHKEVEYERARLHEEIIAAQEAAIRELSTPLLPIGPGILAMPLIGTIDTTRGRHILDTLLMGIHAHHAAVAILDVTGVREMNTEVADILLRSAQAAQLLGTHVLLTGVSPFVAKTIIQLGADLSRIKTLATLEQGIRTAFAHTRLYKEQHRRIHSPIAST